MLADIFDGLIDLVADYNQMDVNAGWPYLYIIAGPMLALLERSPSNVLTLGLDWARR